MVGAGRWPRLFLDCVLSGGVQQIKKGGSAGLRPVILGHMQQDMSLARFILPNCASSIASNVAWMPTSLKYEATASATWGSSASPGLVKAMILAFSVPGA